MKTITELKAQLADLENVIAGRRAELGAAIAEGRDTGKLAAEIERLERDARAIPAAIAAVERKNAELAAIKAAEAKKAEQWAREELARTEEKAVAKLHELGKLLDQADELRARIPEMTNPVISARAIRGEIDRLYQTSEGEKARARDRQLRG